MSSLSFSLIESLFVSVDWTLLPIEAREDSGISFPLSEGKRVDRRLPGFLDESLNAFRRADH